MTDKEIVRLAQRFDHCIIIEGDGWPDDALWFDENLIPFSKALLEESEKHHQEVCELHAQDLRERDAAIASWADKCRKLQARIDEVVALLTTRTRCSACGYEHGHQIGCKNNPLDYRSPDDSLRRGLS